MKCRFMVGRTARRPLPACGYTIVETLVVLAVTAVLFTMAVTLMQGQQSKTEFDQAMRDFDATIRDVIDDTQTGFFPSMSNFSCNIDTAAAPGDAVKITQDPVTNRPQGTNSDCLFLGKTLQMGVATAGCSAVDFDNCTDMRSYTVAGRARVGKAQTTNLQQADPTVVAPLTENLFTKHGLHITRVYSDLGAGFPIKDYGSLAFFATLGQYGGTTDLLSGAQSVNVMLVPNTSMGQVDVGGSSATASINAMDGLDESAAAELTNPANGIIICLAGTNHHRGAVVIGANNRKLTTEIIIEGGLEDRYSGAVRYSVICPS